MCAAVYNCSLRFLNFRPEIMVFSKKIVVFLENTFFLKTKIKKTSPSVPRISKRFKMCSWRKRLKTTDVDVLIRSYVSRKTLGFLIKLGHYE